MKNWLHGGELGEAKIEDGNFAVVEGKEPVVEGEGQGKPISYARPSKEDAFQERKEPNSQDKLESKSMREEKPPTKPFNDRIIVLHCKAGKGRSGSMSVSYLISECGWLKVDALNRFTERRMLPGFGPGISIPSQVRWVDYVERWAKIKRYIDCPVEVVQIHCWGLKSGVRVEVEGFVDEGRRIKVFHAFERDEMVVDGRKEKPRGEKVGFPKRSASRLIRRGKTAAKAIVRFPKGGSSGREADTSGTATPISGVSSSPSSDKDSVKSDQADGQAVIFKPNKPVILPTSDVNVALERKSLSSGLSVTTAVAHTWFNVFFEGEGPERLALMPEERPLDGGVFSVNWEEMDGVKGSRQRGLKAVDRIDVVWKVAVKEDAMDKADGRGTVTRMGEETEEPREGDAVKEPGPADWRE